jgi:hydroxyethylthiazole kinase-like uncharacterized protein yjeF
MGQLQLKRAEALKIKICTKIKKADIYIDALFGTGVNRELSKQSYEIIEKLNKSRGYKIACDIPTGIYEDGTIGQTAFIADTTITMGALKTSMFGDDAKDYIGKIKVVNLGVESKNFQTDTDKFLLTKKDLKLPYRIKKSTNKGDFGHLSVIAGDKLGASYLCALGGFSFGAGLVSVVGNKISSFIEIMNSDTIAKNTTAICIGMGLGSSRDDIIKQVLNTDVPLVLDADMFYKNSIIEFLSKENIVLTPHPKEFASLLGISKICDVSTKDVTKNRFLFVKKFSDKFPKVVLLLKGANTLIAHKGNIYINRYGTNNLAKGGSGDVLSGLIGALLAGGETPLNSAIYSSLAHSLAAKKLNKNSYALNPRDIIESLSNLKHKQKANS